MHNAWKIICCEMSEAQDHLNANAEEWALHMFLPTPDQSRVTLVLLSQKVLRMNQLGRAN